MSEEHSVHHAGCSCTGPALGRRSLLKYVTAGALLAPLPALAQKTAKCDVFLLSCMDYRLVTDVTKYMTDKSYYDNYDHVILAGASLAAVTAKFPDWNKTFWEHLGIAIKLHGVSKLMVMDHRDCGAYSVVYGQDFAKDPAAELKIHTEVMTKLDKLVQKHQPSLSREYYLMNLDKTVDPIAV